MLVNHRITIQSNGGMSICYGVAIALFVID